MKHLLAAALLVLAWTSGASGRPVAPADTVRVLVVYHSETGNTEKMARGVAEGVAAVPDAVAVVRSVEDATPEDLAGADAVALGSPTYWGNVSGTMKTFIDGWLSAGVDLEGKVGGAFATGGGMSGGKEWVVMSLVRALLGAGMIVVGPVYRIGGVTVGNAGPTAATMAPYEGVGEDELGEARALGKRLAEVAARLRPGAAP